MIRLQCSASLPHHVIVGGVCLMLQSRDIASWLPQYSGMKSDEQHRLRGIVRVLLAEKRWTLGPESEPPILFETMQLAVASRAAMLLIGHQRPRYFRSIDTVVFHTEGLARDVRDQLGVVHVGAERLAGQAGSGVISLDWDSVAIDRSGRAFNVVVHEFAHALDEEDGLFDGAPRFAWRGRGARASRRRFAEVMAESFEALQAGEGVVLDPYGATNPAEFFAVTSETFFERPRLLKEWHEDLYEVLESYYQVDPIDWG